MTTEYQMLVDDTMVDLIRKILTYIQDEGFKESQCFYISFRTDDARVILSKKIKSKFPKEITIILQYQYKNLQVLEDRFSVSISFSGRYEKIEVPYSSIIYFSDSSINVSLQFRDVRHNKYISKDFISSQDTYNREKKAGFTLKNKSEKVINIEQFRNKHS